MVWGRLNPVVGPSFLVSPPSRKRWSQASIVIKVREIIWLSDCARWDLSSGAASLSHLPCPAYTATVPRPGALRGNVAAEDCI